MSSQGGVRSQDSLIMDNCMICGGENKYLLEDYTIRTRIPGQESILVENVRFLQCKVCDNKELTKSSKDMIKKIRVHYTQKYRSDRSSGNESRFHSLMKRIGIL